MRGGENLGRGELKKKEKRNEKEWKKKRKVFTHIDLCRSYINQIYFSL